MLHQPFIDDARSCTHTPAAEHTPETKGFGPEIWFSSSYIERSTRLGVISSTYPPPINININATSTRTIPSQHQQHHRHRPLPPNHHPLQSARSRSRPPLLPVVVAVVIVVVGVIVISIIVVIVVDIVICRHHLLSSSTLLPATSSSSLLGTSFFLLRIWLLSLPIILYCDRHRHRRHQNNHPRYYFR